MSLTTTLRVAIHMAMRKDVDIRRLREVVDYNPDTGKFRWKHYRGRAAIGKEAGSFNSSNGYITIGIDCVVYYAHRVAWAYVTGEWPKFEIDHKNSIRTDNRFENLRSATRAQNGKNVSISTRNTSGLKGVHFCNRARRWIAKTRVDGQIKYLGSFHTKEEAHIAYANGSIKHHGDFSRIR